MKNTLFSTAVAATLLLPPSLFGDESELGVAQDLVGRAAQQPDAEKGKRAGDADLTFPPKSVPRVVRESQPG